MFDCPSLIDYLWYPITDFTRYIYISLHIFTYLYISLHIFNISLHIFNISFHAVRVLKIPKTYQTYSEGRYGLVDKTHPSNTRRTGEPLPHPCRAGGWMQSQRDWDQAAHFDIPEELAAARPAKWQDSFHILGSKTQRILRLMCFMFFGPKTMQLNTMAFTFCFNPRII